MLKSASILPRPNLPKFVTEVSTLQRQRLNCLPTAQVDDQESSPAAAAATWAAARSEPSAKGRSMLRATAGAEEAGKAVWADDWVEESNAVPNTSRVRGDQSAWEEELRETSANHFDPIDPKSYSNDVALGAEQGAEVPRRRRRDGFQVTSNISTATLSGLTSAARSTYTGRVTIGARPSRSAPVVSDVPLPSRPAPQ